MVFFNWATMQMAAKIVYYGPGLCGKTTNLSYIYAKTSPNSRGEMVSLETESDRTLFFDLLPIEVGTIGGFRTRLQLYTVPGQVFYNTTRKLVLKGVDGVVFVADSQRPMREANIESFANLRDNLSELGLSLDDVPLVLQYNKRDLKNILTLEELTADLNSDEQHPFRESSAIVGTGVFETLKEITKLTLRKLRSRMAAPESTAHARVEAPAVIPRVPAEAGRTISAASLARAAEEGVDETPPGADISPTPTEAGPEVQPSAEEAPMAGQEAVGSGLEAEPETPAPEPEEWVGPLPDDITQPNPILSVLAEADAPPRTMEPELEEIEAAVPAFDQEPEELAGDDIVELPEPAGEAEPELQVAAEPPEAAPAAAEEVRSDLAADLPEPFEPPAEDVQVQPRDLPEEPAEEEEAPETSAPPEPLLEAAAETEPPRAEPVPVQEDAAAADVEVEFERQEEAVAVTPPPIKRVHVSSQMDILAELETLRKQATNGSFAPAPQSARSMDLDSLLSGEPDARKELRHAIAKSLNSGIFRKMRTMQLAIRIQDAAGETIQTLEPVAMDLDDASSLRHLSLKLTLDLENNG